MTSVSTSLTTCLLKPVKVRTSFCAVAHRGIIDRRLAVGSHPAANPGLAVRRIRLEALREDPPQGDERALDRGCLRQRDLGSDPGLQAIHFDEQAAQRRGVRRRVLASRYPRPPCRLGASRSVRPAARTTWARGTRSVCAAQVTTVTSARPICRRQPDHLPRHGARRPLGWRPRLTTWQPHPPMPTPKHGIWAAVIGNTIYLPGGATAQGFSATTSHEAVHRERALTHVAEFR